MRGAGGELLILDNLSREGSSVNLRWLRGEGRFRFSRIDIRSARALNASVREFRPQVIFHLAGQVAMTTSISNPRRDFETNALGTLNLLEAVRRNVPDAAVIYSSTNKVYGDLEHLEYAEGPSRYVAKGFEHGFDESVPLDFRSPYGCSKGSADQYMLDYARVFGLKTVVFRHSSIYGGRQFSTHDQGWIGWFVGQALKTKGQPDREPFTISGNGKQVRDVLFSDDLVQCYFKAAANIDRIRGNAFNIGGGAENSLSLLELFTFLGRELHVTLRFANLPPRCSDQKVFVANIKKAHRLFGWSPTVGKEKGLRNMIHWVSKHVV